MAFLLLSDGTIFHGISVGADTFAVGEMVFNTSHLGYQEILTDPSYDQQVINFTSPHVGNIGINQHNFESSHIHAAGAIFRSFSEEYFHWQAHSSLSDLLKSQGVPALSEIDTRALTLHLRENGCQLGCVVGNNLSLDAALDAISVRQNEASRVSTQAAYLYKKDGDAHLVVVDCGLKAGILSALARFPVKITVVPQSVTFQTLMALKPDGVLLSNGPGDPRHCESLIIVTQHLLQSDIPVFGICLGHQILALSAGAHIKKMKFGHHGANHPIQCLETGSVFISSQNHNYVVDESHLPDCFKITHVSLFDGTIAGLEHRTLAAFSFQGHPEANPGPRELSYLFQKFIEKVHHA